MLTTQDIADQFNAAGIDDATKLGAFLKSGAAAVKVRQLEKQISDLQTQQSNTMATFNQQAAPIDTARSAAMKPFSDQIAAIRAQIATASSEL